MIRDTHEELVTGIPNLNSGLHFVMIIHNSEQDKANDGKDLTNVAQMTGIEPAMTTTSKYKQARKYTSDQVHE